MKREDKKAIIKKFGQHLHDTGSPQVQVAILTERINSLAAHLETHSKDKHSRRGLLKMVGERRKHLQYLSLKNKEEYEKLLEQLKLRK